MDVVLSVYSLAPRDAVCAFEFQKKEMMVAAVSFEGSSHVLVFATQRSLLGLRIERKKSS